MWRTFNPKKTKEGSSKGKLEKFLKISKQLFIVISFNLTSHSLSLSLSLFLSYCSNLDPRKIHIPTICTIFFSKLGIHRKNDFLNKYHKQKIWNLPQRDARLADKGELRKINDSTSESSGSTDAARTETVCAISGHYATRNDDTR